MGIDWKALDETYRQAWAGKGEAPAYMALVVRGVGLVEVSASGVRVEGKEATQEQIDQVTDWLRGRKLND